MGAGGLGEEGGRCGSHMSVKIISPWEKVHNVKSENTHVGTCFFTDEVAGFFFLLSHESSLACSLRQRGFKPAVLLALKAIVAVITFCLVLHICSYSNEEGKLPLWPALEKTYFSILKSRGLPLLQVYLKACSSGVQIQNTQKSASLVKLWSSNLKRKRRQVLKILVTLTLVPNAKRLKDAKLVILFLQNYICWLLVLFIV